MNDNNDIKIEKGIPLPEPRTIRGSISSVIKKMEVGDSILVTERQRQAAFASAHDVKVKLTSQHVGNGKVRVWRLQ